MATVMRQTSTGDYDLERGFRLYDTTGDLPQRARRLWDHISGAEQQIALEFWLRYARSPEVKDSIDDAKAADLADKILPYIRDKFTRIDQSEWVEQAKSYVENALKHGLTLSTLLSGVSAETEAAFTAIRASVSDPAEQIELARTLSETQMIEIDAFIHHAINFTRIESGQAQSRQASEFNTKVMGGLLRQLS